MGPIPKKHALRAELGDDSDRFPVALPRVRALGAVPGFESPCSIKPGDAGARYLAIVQFRSVRPLRRVVFSEFAAVFNSPQGNDESAAIGGIQPLIPIPNGNIDSSSAELDAGW